MLVFTALHCRTHQIITIGGVAGPESGILRAHQAQAKRFEAWKAKRGLCRCPTQRQRGPASILSLSSQLQPAGSTY